MFEHAGECKADIVSLQEQEIKQLQAELEFVRQEHINDCNKMDKQAEEIDRLKSYRDYVNAEIKWRRQPQKYNKWLSERTGQ